MHARPDQVRHRLPGHEDGRPARQAAASRPTSSPRISAATASCRRARPITWCCSCSRWASRRASGARCSTRCSTSRSTTTATRRSRKSCPAIAAAAPQRYAGKGLKDLGDEMWAHLRKSRQGHWQAQAYATLPEPEMTPRRAFQRLMAGDAEKVPLDQDGRPRRRGRRDSVSARHSDRHAGREHRSRPTARGSRTCARCRSTGIGSPDSPRKSRAPKSTTAFITSIA